MTSFEAVLTCVVATPMQNEEWTNNVLVNVKVIYLSLDPGGCAAKGWVCGRSLAGIGLEPHRRMDICLYVQVTVHRDNLRVNNQQDASSIQNFILSRNCTSFGHLLCPSSGVISCTRGNWYVSCRLCGRCLAESGWNSSGHITCMKHTNCHVYSR